MSWLIICAIFSFQNGLWSLEYKHNLGLNGPKARYNDQLEDWDRVSKKEEGSYHDNEH